MAGETPAARARQFRKEGVMIIEIERTEGGSWAQARRAVACFLCLMGLPFLVLVLAAVQPVRGVVTSL